MAEPVFPKACAKEIEEERKDAVFYRNPYMYEVCELAALGLLAKQLLAKGVLPEELVAKLVELQAKQEVVALAEKPHRAHE